MQQISTLFDHLVGADQKGFVTLQGDPKRSSGASIVETTIQVQDDCMEHRGVRYAIRQGITPGQWSVAIYPPDDGALKERTVFGTRKDAETTARSMISALLKKAIRPS